MCNNEPILKIEKLKFPDVLLLTPHCIRDNRGFFVERFNEDSFTVGTGLNTKFVRDCMSMSLHPGTVRGLHYQSPPHVMAKLVSVVTGRIRDIVVDIRRGSPTYGQHVCIELSADNHKQLFIPAGYLHGLVTLEPNTCVMYKMDMRFSPSGDGAIRWDDPDLSIDWDLAPNTNIIISERDASAQLFADFVSPFEYQCV
jgi:dTDP-4-dehydrorhamnose 3,5-epimerase